MCVYSRSSDNTLCVVKLHIANSALCELHSKQLVCFYALNNQITVASLQLKCDTILYAVLVCF